MLVLGGWCTACIAYAALGGLPVMSDTTPAWLNSQEGITKDVLPPWTPLTVRAVPTTAPDGEPQAGLEIRCWGRNYGFGHGPFPASVESAGKSVLAAPIRLIARAEGREERWRAELPQVQEATPGRAVLSAKMQGDRLLVAARIALEYDGMVQVDWAVSAPEAARLDELTLEIPLKPEHAKYLYYYPHYERSWQDHKPRALGEQPFLDSFRPVLWLGDEERGLMWFSESDENWASDQPERAVEVRQEGQEVVARLRIVSRPVDIGPQTERRSLDYMFGFLATPVKPVQEDAWDLRTFHISQSTYGEQTRLAIPEAELDRLAALGVKTVCFHEHWTDIESHTTTTYGEDLKRLVAGGHARGMQLLLYFGFLLSDLAPEWEQWSDQCLLEPRRGYEPYNYPPQPLQNALVVCYRSPWQDFLVDGIARLMDEYQFDGVYLDGTASPFGGCANRRHGCGYQGAGGEMVPTYALLPIRETLRRIYAVVKSRKPEGQVNVHQSAYMTPALPYFTSYWDGEQLTPPESGRAYERLPLDMFRTEFMGHQWGVPAEFLHYTLGLSLRQALAISLPHDVPTRPVTVPDLEELAGLWRAFDRFGRKQAEWVPYWRVGNLVRTEPEGIVVSLYRHPTNGVLAVVSNLSGARREARVRFDCAALGIESGMAIDALTGEQIPLRDGVATFDLEHLDWRLLWIGGGGAEG